MDKKIKYIRVNTRVLADQHKWIKKFAKGQGMTEGDVHREAVENFIKKHSK